MLLCPFPPHTPLQFPALSSGEELLPLRGLLLPLGRRREAAQMHVASQIFSSPASCEGRTSSFSASRCAIWLLSGRRVRKASCSLHLQISRGHDHRRGSGHPSRGLHLPTGPQDRGRRREGSAQTRQPSVFLEGAAGHIHRGRSTAGADAKGKDAACAHALMCVCVCVCVWSVCFECFGKSKAMNSEGFNAALMSVMQNLGLLCVASRFLQPRKAGAKADVGAGTEFELLAADTGAGSVSKCVNMHFVLKNQDLMSSNNVFCQFLPCLAEITIPAGLTDSSWAH